MKKKFDFGNFFYEREILMCENISLQFSDSTEFRIWNNFTSGDLFLIIQDILHESLNIAYE